MFQVFLSNSSQKTVFFFIFRYSYVFSFILLISLRFKQQQVFWLNCITPEHRWVKYTTAKESSQDLWIGSTLPCTFSLVFQVWRMSSAILPVTSSPLVGCINLFFFLLLRVQTFLNLLFLVKKHKCKQEYQSIKLKTYKYIKS